MQPEVMERKAEWFLVNAEQKDLDLTVKRLSRDGMDAFVPRVLRDEIGAATDPLFPGYVFAFLDPNVDTACLERHLGKVMFVTNSNWRPLPIPRSIVGELKVAERSVFKRKLSIMAHEYRVEALVAEVFYRRNS